LKPLGGLQFYQKRSGQEIDFIFKRDTAIEIKEIPVVRDEKSLVARASPLGIDLHFLVGHRPSGGGFENFVWAGSIF
jgi:hypothetical protein